MGNTPPSAASAAVTLRQAPLDGSVDEAELFASMWGDDLVPEDFRTHMHLVDERLYLGNNNAAHDFDLLSSNGVTHIVNCLGLECMPLVHLNLFTYFTIDVDDIPQQDLSSIFYTVTDFISGALEDPTNVVFVHCAAGVSRSAAIVIAFIMRKYRLTAAESYNKVRAVRKIISPNDGFQRQLVLWQRHLLHDVALPVSPTPITHSIISPKNL
jgi:hypothetical protein